MKKTHLRRLLCLMLSLCFVAVLLPVPGSATRGRSIYRLTRKDTYRNGVLSGYTLYDYVYEDLLYSKKEYNVENGRATLWRSEMNVYNNVPELEYHEETLNGRTTTQTISMYWPEDDRSVETIVESVKGESGTSQITRETKYNANGRPVAVYEETNGINYYTALYSYTRKGQVKDCLTKSRSPYPNSYGETVILTHHVYDRYGNNFSFNMNGRFIWDVNGLQEFATTHERVDADGELYEFTIDLNDEHVTAYYDHRHIVHCEWQDADGVQTRYYDAEGNLERSVYRANDGNVYTTEYTYEWVYAPPEPTFTDVSEDDYYFNPVEWAVESRITKGTSFSTFSPDATCTRGQVVTFLWRALGGPEPKSTVNPFRDVSPSDYYYKAVLWANEQGITNGTSATTFSPNAPCTRGQVVTFLWRSEGKPIVGGSNPFLDVMPDAYYTDAVLWAVSQRITNGMSPAAFWPDAQCTRAQVVTFLYRDLAVDPW